MQSQGPGPGTTEHWGDLIITRDIIAHNGLAALLLVHINLAENASSRAYRKLSTSGKGMRSYNAETGRFRDPSDIPIPDSGVVQVWPPQRMEHRKEGTEYLGGASNGACRRDSLPKRTSRNARLISQSS